MAYRNGTYVAFHANGTDVPVESDIKYYNLLKAWTEKSDDDFTMVNSHDKASAVRDTSLKTTLRSSLLHRLRNSRNMLLIVGETTRFDTDWVPFEIEQAVDSYEIPIIAVYPTFNWICAPAKLEGLWPYALKARIQNRSAFVLHIPFKKQPIKAAIDQFDHDNLPPDGLSHYTHESYVNWGLA